MTTNYYIIAILATISASLICIGTYLAPTNPELGGNILGYTIIVSLLVLPTSAIILHNEEIV